jgi:hypothetical protein
MSTFIARRIQALFVLFAVFVTAASGCATSKSSAGAATSTGNVALDYYPLLPGWGWAYDVEREGQKVLALYSVAECRGNVAVIKNGDARIEYLVQLDGIARREGSLPGDYLLRLPMVVGATWPVAGGHATVAELGKAIALPSGNYRDCVVVEETRNEPQRVTRTTYCKGVGPVAIDMRVYNPMKLDFETVVRATLLSVTRPEDTAKAD